MRFVEHDLGHSDGVNSGTPIGADVYQSILDGTGRMIYVIDRHTFEFLYANRKGRESIGVSDDFPAGLTCHAVRGSQNPCESCIMQRVDDAGELDITEFDDQHDTWDHLTGHRIEWEGRDAFLLFVDDVTELKRAESDAIKHRSMYEAAVEEAKLVVWEYDIANHRVIMSDNEFTRYDYRKFSLPKVVDNVPQSLVPYIDEASVDDFLAMYRKVEEGAPQASCEVWYKTKPEQEPRYMRLSYTTVFDENHKPVSAFGIAQNITARKLEEQKFTRMFGELAQVIPDSLGSFRLNLTKGTCTDGRSPFDSVMKQQESGTVEGYLAESARIIADDDARKRFLDTFSRDRLLKSFRDGVTHITQTYPVHIPLPDGEIHWIEGSLSMAQNPRTGDIEAVTTGIDVTERKHTEMIMGVLSREVFGFIILLDMTTGKIIIGGETSEHASERYGHEDYTSAMVAALQRMMPPETLEEAVQAHSIDNIRTQLVDKRGFELSFTTKDGRYLHWRFAYADKERTTVLIMREDITDITRNEQRRIHELEDERRAHQHTTALLESILDTAPVAMFWKDRDRRFEGANKAFLDFYGFDSLDAILGKNDEDMGWHPDPGPYKGDELSVIYEGTSTKRVPGECMSHGKLCHIVASKSPRYENGAIVGLVGNFEDVTKEYEHAEKISALNASLKVALDEAEKASVAEQVFLSSMSHDMRTPLNGILGFSDLALKTDDLQKKQDYLEKIDTSGRLMLDLVNDVLDLSKIESGKMELLPQAFESRGLFKAVIDSVMLSAEQRGVTLAARMADDYPRFILADRLRVQQIALNLLSNSIKYTPSGGTVTFEVAPLATPVDGCNTCLTVSDTGIGMSSEFQKRMFEPFAQEHQSRMYGIQGTGLGLSIVKRIVDLMEGHIEVSSTLGKGTTFHVLLPMPKVEAGKVDDGHRRGYAGNIVGKHILLCEDNDLNAEIAMTILQERAGAVVKRAFDGKEGVELFEGSAAGTYDAILMDVRMPVMDGLEATRTIRALDRPDACTIPIVAMTADAFAEDAQNCMDAGMDGHISKPIDPTLLISVVADQCNHGRGGASR